MEVLVSELVVEVDGDVCCGVLRVLTDGEMVNVGIRLGSFRYPNFCRFENKLFAS